MCNRALLNLTSRFTWFTRFKPSFSKLWLYQINLRWCNPVTQASFVCQDPGEHGRQHHRALLQRRHLHPQHRELRRRLQDHADRDLTARQLTRRGKKKRRCDCWLAEIYKAAIDWLISWLTVLEKVHWWRCSDAPRSTSTHLIPLWHCYTMKQVGFSVQEDTIDTNTKGTLQNVSWTGFIYFLIVLILYVVRWNDGEQIHVLHRFYCIKEFVLLFCTVLCFCQTTHQE